MKYQPSFECYTEHASKNYGLNSLRFFDASNNVFWFSYTTLVAFKTPGGPRVVIENTWGPTTGRHLNAIDDGDKASRVDAATFNRFYDETFNSEAAGIDPRELIKDDPRGQFQNMGG